MESKKNNIYTKACKILHNNIQYFILGYYDTFDDFIEKTFIEWDNLIEDNNEL